MAVRAGFQCRAAGWHSDEDNDVLVSHRITQQTRSHRAGVGRLGAPTAPAGAQSLKGLAFSVPIVQWSSSKVQEGRNEAGSTHMSNVQRGSIHIIKGQFNQLGRAGCGSGGLCVCLFIHFSPIFHVPPNQEWHEGSYVHWSPLLDYMRMCQMLL